MIPQCSGSGLRWSRAFTKSLIDKTLHYPFRNLYSLHSVAGGGSKNLLKPRKSLILTRTSEAGWRTHEAMRDRFSFSFQRATWPRGSVLSFLDEFVTLGPRDLSNRKLAGSKNLLKSRKFLITDFGDRVARAWSYQGLFSTFLEGNMTRSGR